MAFPTLPFRRIALVGNGPIDPPHAATIDAHDIVVRFNSCANYGVTGTKTDAIVICNSGVSGKRFAVEPDAIDAFALASTEELWFAKPLEVVIFEERLSGERHDLCGDYTREIVASRATSCPWIVFDYRTYMEAKHAITNRGASVVAQPSTGLIALFHIKRTLWWPRVTLYGFTHQGWEGHDWAVERAIFNAFKWVKRVQDPPTSQSSRAYEDVPAAH